MEPARIRAVRMGSMAARAEPRSDGTTLILPLAQLAEARRAAEQKGLLQVEPDRLVATPRGQLFLNDLLQYFLT